MKSTWDIRQEKLVAGGNARTEHDSLTLPGGRKPIDVTTSDLARLLIAAGIPGTSHANGRDANLAAYAKHLEEIHKRAGDQVVYEWIKAHK